MKSECTKKDLKSQGLYSSSYVQLACRYGLTDIRFLYDGRIQLNKHLLVAPMSSQKMIQTLSNKEQNYCFRIAPHSCSSTVTTLSKAKALNFFLITQKDFFDKENNIGLWALAGSDLEYDKVKIEKKGQKWRV